MIPLGIVSDEISRDFREAVRIGTSLGIRRYEVRNLTEGRAPMCGDPAMLEVERIAQGEGVEITALSPGLFKFTQDEPTFRREMTEVLPRAIEWANRWKLPGLIVFGFHKPAVPQIADWLAEAASHIPLMIEPEPICCCDTGRATVALIQGLPNIRINYDPGNVAWLTNRDPIDEFEIVAPYIANVHIKDIRPVTDPPEWVPPGEGIIDYRAHFQAFQRINYQGPISLEPHMDFTAEATRRCKIAVERLWEKEEL